MRTVFCSKAESLRGIRIWIRSRPAKMSCLQQLVLDSACCWLNQPPFGYSEGIAIAGVVSHFDMKWCNRARELVFDLEVWQS